MVRKTALVTAMLGAFASQAIAMGLGEIQLHSALNQPLLAEIELLSPTAADLNDLRATLASREAYAKAGVERGFFHTKLRFEVIKRPNGTAAIKVTSHDPVREPYLDFLLEATWGSGQALREYTVLVDPPVLMPAPAPEYEAPVTEYTAPAPTSSAPVYSGGGAASGLVDGEYHVSRNDTTWGVANTVRPDGSVSMEQVMISLLRANPNAFINQNINNLKAGQILRVPSREEMAAITHAAAVADVRAQTNQWRSGSAAAPTPAASATPSETPAAPASDAAVQAADADAQLKLVAPKAEEDTAAAKATTGDQSLDEIRKELTLASEAMEAQRLENSDLSSRVKELEDQISKLHGLIELKDSEMARLAGTAAPTADGAAAPGTEVAPGETAPTTDAELTAPTAPMAETPAAETPAEDTSAAVPADEAATPETESAVPAPEVVAAAPPTKPSAADEGTMSALLANPLIKWGAVGGAVVIGLLAWMSGRRRRMEDANFQESILAGKHPGGAKKAVSTASPVAAAATVAAAAAAVAQPKAPKVPQAKDAPQTDSSLFTDFAVSDMGNIQSDAEADPIAEADVYLAYGRYQQAEELIRTALTRAPQRNELRFKLLEVLFAAKNAHAFDTEAEALLATLGSQEDEMWLRAVDMGQELNPGNPLYRAGGMATATAAAELDSGMDFNLGSMGTAEADFTTPQRDDNSLDFDLGEFDAFSPQAGDAAPSMPIEEDLNFDLSMGDETEDAGEGLLASADEVATKLDLARAYVEMGDPDGARSILQEVLDEGNGEQKSEAQTLLSQIT